MGDLLGQEVTKRRAQELVRLARRVVTLERRLRRLTDQAGEVLGELRTAKRLLRDVAADQPPLEGGPSVEEAGV